MGGVLLILHSGAMIYRSQKAMISATHLLKSNSAWLHPMVSSHLWLEFSTGPSSSVSEDSAGVEWTEERVGCGDDESGSVVLDEVVEIDADRCWWGGWCGWMTTTTVDACEVVSSSSEIFDSVEECVGSSSNDESCWMGNFGNSWPGSDAWGCIPKSEITGQL